VARNAILLAFDLGADQRQNVSHFDVTTICERAETFGNHMRDLWREFARPVTFFDERSPQYFPANETREFFGKWLARQDSFPFPTSQRRLSAVANSQSELARPAGLEPAAPGLKDRCPFGRARAEGQSVIPGLSRRRPRVRVPSTPPHPSLTLGLIPPTFAHARYRA
jgi:hypothetical protein